MSTPPPIPKPGLPPLRESWWSRNWKWFVPVVGLGAAGIVTLVVVFFFFVFGVMRSSDAYKNAISRAHADERVTSALGTPITEGKFFTGNISTNNDRGYANLQIPMSGPKGTATLEAIAYKSDGVWIYTLLEVTVKDEREKINLLTPEEQKAATRL